jgi:hypothetical protein
MFRRGDLITTGGYVGRGPLISRPRNAFNPFSLPGLAAWYDASDSSTVLTTVSPDVPATDGQTVRRWLDKSGAGRHLNQETLANQRVLDRGGLDGAGWLTATFNYTTPLSVFCAFQADSWADLRSLFSADGGSPGVRQRTTANEYGLWSTEPERLSVGLNTPAVMWAGFGTTGKFRLNTNNATAAGTYGVADGATRTQIFVGTDGAVTGRTFDGPIQELIYVSGVVSEETATRVFQYLARKRGATI